MQNNTASQFPSLELASLRTIDALTSAIASETKIAKIDLNVPYYEG